MKSTSILFLFLFFASTLSALADAAMQTELKQLKDQRTRAIAAAVDPVNRRYQAALELLLRRATQGNDLELAVKIKEELKTVSSEASAPAAIDFALTPIEKAVAGTKWQFGSIGVVEFDRAGNSIAHWNSSKYPIKRVSQDTVAIFPWSNPKVAVHLQFNENLTKATIVSSERSGMVLERVK